MEIIVFGRLKRVIEGGIIELSVIVIFKIEVFLFFDFSLLF
jgi:hypothetical protein